MACQIKGPLSQSVSDAAGFVIVRRPPSHPSLPETEGAEGVKGVQEGGGSYTGKSGVRG